MICRGSAVGSSSILTSTPMPLPASLCLCCPCRDPAVLGPRQAYREFTILPELAVDRDHAAVLLRDDIVADRQAEAGALAGRFRGEKGLEQSVARFGRDADAVVAHAQF